MSQTTHSLQGGGLACGPGGGGGLFGGTRYVAAKGDKMTAEVRVAMVVVTAGRDSYWDIVNISRAGAKSQKHLESSVREVACSVQPLALRGTVHQPNECNNSDVIVSVTKECDPAAGDALCFCGHECLVNGVVKYSTPGKPRFKHLHIQTEVLYFAAFLQELQRSLTYRLLVLQRWGHMHSKKYIKTSTANNVRNVVIQVMVQDTIPHVVDYAWGERLCRCGQERQHLDAMMSWLSTLGGACSALGDYLEAFAERAWAISLQQLEIAQRLGDPTIVSRCRLYAAISLIQQCKFKLAAKIVKSEYLWAHSFIPEARDIRLIRMCHGIWAKLRYEKETYSIRHTTNHSTRTI